MQWLWRSIFLRQWRWIRPAICISPTRGITASARCRAVSLQRSRELPGLATAATVLSTVSSLYSPQGVAVDSSGNIYIADTSDNRVLKVTASTGLITTIAGTGTQGYSGDGASGTAAALNRPSGVAVDPTGNVIVADTGNSVIRRISTGGTITTTAGNGTPGYGGDGGLAKASQLNGPTSVAVDPTGGFTYIADSGNNAVRVFTNAVISGVIPHFAAGGTYVTGLYVINKGTTAQQFTINFYNDGTGAPVSVPVTIGTSTSVSNGTTLTDTLPALGTGYYELGTLTNPTVVSGSATIQSNAQIVVQVFFRHQGAAVTPYETTYNTTLGSYEALFGFDATVYAPTNTQIYTAIALANIDSANSGLVTCVVRDNTGTVIPNAITVPTLAPQGHWAAYQFPAITGKRGTIDCTSTTKMAPIALKFIGTDGLATLPVILK